MQHFTASDGMRLAYRVDDFTDPWRKPECLLLLHSAMGCAQRFVQWIPRLARRFIVVTPDLRGHGESEIPPPDKALTLERLVEDAAELMNTLGIDAAHVIGNSAGGYVAQRLAMTYPKRVKTLALYGALPGLKNSNAMSWLPQVEKKGLRAFLAETIADRFPQDIDPRQREWFLDQTGSCNPAYIARFITHMASRFWEDELHKIGCPTLIVAPGAEPIGSHDGYVRMAERIKGSTLVTYDGMPHNICDAVPDRCVDDALAFLARHARAD